MNNIDGGQIKFQGQIVPCSIYIAGGSFPSCQCKYFKKVILAVTKFNILAENVLKTSTWDGTFPNSTLSVDLSGLLGTDVRGRELSNVGSGTETRV